VFHFWQGPNDTQTFHFVTEFEKQLLKPAVTGVIFGSQNPPWVRIKINDK